MSIETGGPRWKSSNIVVGKGYFGTENCVEPFASRCQIFVLEKVSLDAQKFLSRCARSLLSRCRETINKICIIYTDNHLKKKYIRYTNFKHLFLRLVQEYCPNKSMTIVRRSLWRRCVVRNLLYSLAHSSATRLAALVSFSLF